MAGNSIGRQSLLVVLALVGAAYVSYAPISALPTITIVGVAADHSSVRVSYAPVAGAQDYRIYDVNSPTAVKYAGRSHITAGAGCPGQSCTGHFVAQADGVTPVFPYQVASGGTGGPQALDVPATEIEWNNVGDGLAHTIVVEAVDQVGPVPQASLYNGSFTANTPLVSPLPPGTMLGMNKGPTADGKNSTNGQGPYTNLPNVVAASAPFQVMANRSYTAIPSKPSAGQTFFDTFENAENSTIQLVTRNDTQSDQFGTMGFMKYSMNAGTPKAWEIIYRQANDADSMPFISADHFMDVLFDGGTPGVSPPTHTLYASMAMTPTATLDLTNGKIAHLTMEVDGHQSFRRWMDFQLAPASDPLQGWEIPGFAVNNADQAVFLEFKDGQCTLDVFTGPTSPTSGIPTGTAGGVHGSRLWGQAGSVGGGAVMCDLDQMYVKNTFSKNGLGLDDKSRYDFFISKTHAAVFQDGQLIVESDIPAGTFPWADAGPLRAYFAHYLYHSDVDASTDLKLFTFSGQNYCYPLNSYWFNDPVNGTAPASNVCNAAYPSGYGFPYSDERHWDNMGFETLPASEAPSGSYAVFAPLVQPPPVQSMLGPQPPRNVRIIR
jgi:hypothetical protein